MRKKDLKKWLSKLKRRGVPRRYVKQAPPAHYDAEHLAHMQRDLEIK